MTFSRLFAATAAVAVLAGSTLFIGTAAHADPNHVYVNSMPEVWRETGIAPPAGWSTSTGTQPVFSDDGVLFAAGVIATVSVTPTTDAVGLINSISDDDFFSNPRTAIEIRVLTDVNDPTSGSVISNTAESTDIDPTNTTWSFGLSGGLDLATIEDQLDVDYTSWAITGLGIAPQDGTFNTSHFTIQNVFYDFTPEPQAPPTVPAVVLTPTEITAAALATTGVTAAFTGFAPNELVQASWNNQTSGANIGEPVTADEDGAFTVTFTAADFALGDYTLKAVAPESESSAEGKFTVVAAAAVDPELAVTGIDATPYLMLTGALLALGIFLGVISLRRRRTA